MNNAQESFQNYQNQELEPSEEEEEIFFAEETEPDRTESSWKILIVDDDAEVHNITKLALSDFTFENRSLVFLSAYSAQEAKQLIQAHSDTAIIFLDVVMETEDAGLQLVKYVREELKNQQVRIILRTGQPGRCPEDIVATNYEIDAYKTKTELTAQKLFVTVITALRGFSTIVKLLESSKAIDLQDERRNDRDEILAIERVTQNKGVERNQNLLQALKTQQVEALGNLISEVAREVINSNYANTLYTMSLITWIARMILRTTDEHFAKLGISQSKLAVLIYLSCEPQLYASPSSLAKHCGVSRAAMTGLVDGLEEEGYVERYSHPSDRRSLMIKLTQKGQQFIDSIAPQDQYRLSELMSVLSEIERQKLIELTMKVIKLFEKQASDSLSKSEEDLH
jgi:DNA-binding MarR family transcriptional regulator/CheY-like chemotaxis protein